MAYHSEFGDAAPELFSSVMKKLEGSSAFKLSHTGFLHFGALLHPKTYEYDEVLEAIEHFKKDPTERVGKMRRATDAISELVVAASAQIVNRGKMKGYIAELGKMVSSRPATGPAPDTPFRLTKCTDLMVHAKAWSALKS